MYVKGLKKSVNFIQPPLFTVNVICTNIKDLENHLMLIYIIDLKN